MRTWESLKTKANLAPRALVLEMCVGLSLRAPGHIVEFGVAGGGSTRVIRDAVRRLQADKKIFAFDSFLGLPERFESLEAGYFACSPPVIEGVEIVAGYFEDTLTPELAARIGRVAFAHLDADLYRSTACALRFLTPLVDTGALLQFDQFEGGEGAERRAFEEWTAATGIETALVAEFARGPSGGSNTMDRRVVYQVVGASDLHPEPAGRRAAFQVDYVTAADLAPPGATFRLGAGWYPLETWAGEAFRWVNNDAELVVEAGRKLAVEVEAGPGLGGAPFLLEVLDARGRAVQKTPVTGRQSVEMELAAGVYRLHVEGGGKPCPSDWRILNFRVFRCEYW